MKKRSVVLTIATVLATLYVIYLISYFGGVNSNAQDSSEALGGAIATLLVTPHIIMFAIGAIFGWIGVFFRKSWSALVAAILYAVGAFLFLAYIMFGGPILILGFVGYSKQKKINKKLKEAQ